METLSPTLDHNDNFIETATKNEMKLTDASGNGIKIAVRKRRTDLVLREPGPRDNGALFRIIIVNWTHLI